MRHIARRAALAALTSLAVTASLTAGATNALAINEGTCSRSDFLQITIHRPGENAQMRCYANAGEADLLSANWWVTRISTGNNRVQWYGDGRWQPAQAIDKWTVYTWPNHPGGVRINKVRIL
ncbi:beta/gamma crystallin domain-containing protein [Streptomyces massasporeus]